MGRIVFRSVLVIGMLFPLLNCSTTNKMESRFSNEYDRSQLDEITLVYTAIENDKRFFLSKEEMRARQAKISELAIELPLHLVSEIGEEVKIKSISETFYTPESSEIMQSEIKRIDQYLNDINTLGASALDYTSNLDYTRISDEVNTPFVLVVKIEPDAEEINYDWGTEYVEHSAVFAYLIDTKTGKLVWVLDHFEKVNINDLNAEDFAQTIAHSLLYNRKTSLNTSAVAKR